ncbi:MAG: hypothetical protein AAGH19_10985, partial [Pseudomonadota bacterium]
MGEKDTARQENSGTTPAAADGALPRPLRGRSTGRFRPTAGVVASGHAETSRAGQRILEAGG